MMDCAAFENRLTDLLAGELDPASAREVAAELERHAAGCAGCSAAAGWLEFAALSAGERDPFDEPPTGYWEDFNASVSRRIATNSRQRRAAWWRPLAAAAAIVLALAAGWVLRGRVLTVEQTPLAAGHGASGEWSLLDEVIQEATPEELAEALSRLPGNAWDGGYEADVRGEWLPDTDELDEIDQQQLVEWLDQMDQAEGRPTS